MTPNTFAISIVLVNLFILIINAYQNVSETVRSEDETEIVNKILVRKKRYLVFPEGSSIQLVYCLTVPLYGPPTIFTVGVTASLAWELPHNPYSSFHPEVEDIHRRKDVKKPTYVNNMSSSGWHKYKHQLYQTTANKHQYFYFDSNKKNHIAQNLKYYDKGFGGVTTEYNNKHNKYHSIHHRSRRDLYLKIERFFNAQRKDGRACVLKALCEISQISNKKVGTFFEELMRTIFLWKPNHNEPNNPHYREYDTAYQSTEDCSLLYPSCDSSVWNVFV